jgi:hypothetical protein
MRRLVGCGNLGVDLVHVEQWVIVGELNSFIAFDNGVPMGRPTVVGVASDLVELAAVRD